MSKKAKVGSRDPSRGSIRLPPDSEKHHVVAGYFPTEINAIYWWKRQGGDTQMEAEKRSEAISGAQGVEGCRSLCGTTHQDRLRLCKAVLAMVAIAHPWISALMRNWIHTVVLNGIDGQPSSGYIIRIVWKDSSSVLRLVTTQSTTGQADFKIASLILISTQ